MLALSASHGQCRVKASNSSSPQRKEAGVSAKDLPPSSDDEGSSDGEDYDQSLDSATAIENLAGERGITSSIILSGSVFVNMLAILFLGHTKQRFHGNESCLPLAVHQYLSGKGVLPADPTIKVI